MNLDDLPKQCAFCGLSREVARGLRVSIAVGNDGQIHQAALCQDCIRTFLLELAYSDRTKFEELVEEARAWKPNEP